MKVDFAQFAMAAVQLAVFVIFVTAVIEVMKGISAKGVWGILKELGLALVKNAPLSTETMRTLNFVVALVFLRTFEFGVMTRILGIDVSGFGAFAWWLDYIATASVVYMGADWFFLQFKVTKTKAEAILESGTVIK